jgi:hypothetical protein
MIAEQIIEGDEHLLIETDEDLDDLIDQTTDDGLIKKREIELGTI